MRGEYWCATNECACHAELPPRARRIRAMAPAGLIQRGTTSACAENTAFAPGQKSSCWNYLRVRGEYAHVRVLGPKGRELPPRARRIQVLVSSSETPSGTTSACAENTIFPLSITQSGRNYLRVRGEYLRKLLRKCLHAELPPRARRIRFFRFLSPRVAGTTSACAENTPLSTAKGCLNRNYLRVRGEYSC